MTNIPVQLGLPPRAIMPRTKPRRDDPHKYSTRNIILKYPKESIIVNQEGCKTLSEFPNSIEIGKPELGQDPSHSVVIPFNHRQGMSSYLFLSIPYTNHTHHKSRVVTGVSPEPA
jgi:hypothetical protein